MSNSDILPLSLRGAIFGQLLGNTISYGELSEPSGNDITMLCVMASINECKDVNPTDIVETIYNMYIGNYLVPESSLGPDGEMNLDTVTIRALDNHASGMPTDRCGVREPLADQSPSCLSRILPVALYMAGDSIDKIIDYVHLVCSITHATPLSQVICALYAITIRNLLLDKQEKATELLLDYYKTKKMTEFAEQLEHIRDKRTGVVDCFMSNWNTFVAHENNFIECIQSLKSNSLVVIAGAWAGLVNGINDIPVQLIRSLSLTEEQRQVIDRFIGLVAARYNAA